MIIVKISGGLGNQLFQYSFGKYLSIKFNTELKFDIQTNNNFPEFTQRSFGLRDFDINYEIASVKEIGKYKYFNNKYFARIERKIIQKLPLFNKNYVIQDLYKPLKYNGNYRDNVYYDGYWQSERYFKPIENILKHEFNLKPIIESSNVALLEEIVSSDSVSIHIRRGDYISVNANKAMFSTCSYEYYKHAISYISDKTKNPLFYIFSDDIGWARSNFKGEQFKIVDNSSKTPKIDLYLMSKCKNNIIANSSFSWWGAWLNINPDKIIIAPKKWFLNGMSDIDIMPVDWIKLDND